MQWPAAPLTVGALDLRDVLWMVGAGVVVTVTVALLLAHPRRRGVDDRMFRRLLHRVHDRRELLFVAHQSTKLTRMKREGFLRSARERLRACAFFRRKGDS
jgi:hypothetical protein